MSTGEFEKVKILNKEIQLSEKKDKTGRPTYQILCDNEILNVPNPQDNFRQGLSQAIKNQDLASKIDARVAPRTTEGLALFFEQLDQLYRKGGNVQAQTLNLFSLPSKVKGGTPKSMSAEGFAPYAKVLEKIRGEKEGKSPPRIVETKLTKDLAKWKQLPEIVRWYDRWLDVREETPKSEIDTSPQKLFKFLNEEMQQTPSQFLRVGEVNEYGIYDPLEDIKNSLKEPMYKRKNVVFATDPENRKPDLVKQYGRTNQVGVGRKIPNEVEDYQIGKNFYTNKKKAKPTAWYPFAKAIRGFLGANGVSVTDQPLESPLSQSVKFFSGKYADVEMTDKQMATFESILIKKSKDDKEGFYKDALMMFYIGRSMGLRASELFTMNIMPFNKNLKPEDVDYDNSGANFIESFVTPDFPKGRWKIKAITSKTKWIGQGHTEQWNTDPKLNIIISEKYQKVKNIPSAKGYHSMIGDDNKYITTDTIMFQNPKVTNPQDKNRKKLYTILKQTYKDADIDDNYFQEHPVHALRHMMAQYWLFKTGYDYDWVSKRGHWNTITVLKDSYGKVSDKVQRRKLLAYSEIPDGQSADKELMDLETNGAGNKLVDSDQLWEGTQESDEDEKTEVFSMLDSDPEGALKIIAKHPELKKATKIKNFIKNYKLQKNTMEGKDIDISVEEDITEAQDEL